MVSHLSVIYWPLYEKVLHVACFYSFGKSFKVVSFYSWNVRDSLHGFCLVRDQREKSA